MTALFDGVAELLTDCLGSAVLHRPAVGTPVQIVSIFRTEPIEVLDSDGGPVLISAPTWRVPASRGASISNGDQVEPWDGNTYRIVNRQPSASPGSDRFVIYVLEQVA